MHLTIGVLLGNCIIYKIIYAWSLQRVFLLLEGMCLCFFFYKTSEDLELFACMIAKHCVRLSDIYVHTYVVQECVCTHACPWQWGHHGVILKIFGCLMQKGSSVVHSPYNITYSMVEGPYIASIYPTLAAYLPRYFATW